MDMYSTEARCRFCREQRALASEVAGLQMADLALDDEVDDCRGLARLDRAAAALRGDVDDWWMVMRRLDGHPDVNDDQAGRLAADTPADVRAATQAMVATFFDGDSTAAADAHALDAVLARRLADARVDVVPEVLRGALLRHLERVHGHASGELGRELCRCWPADKELTIDEEDPDA